MSKNIILIDRQYGSGGREVGKMLADKLEYRFMTVRCYLWQLINMVLIRAS